MELIDIVNSNRKNKKFAAIFDVNGKRKVVHFGDNRYEDYTIHKDKIRRNRYRLRHVNDDIRNPMSPGALSWHILWGESTDLESNIRRFRRIFSL